MCEYCNLFSKLYNNRQIKKNHLWQYHFQSFTFNGNLFSLLLLIIFGTGIRFFAVFINLKSIFMKSFYIQFCKTLATAVLVITLNTSAKTQVLTAGEIAFTGYLAGGVGTEAFSFVLLVNVPIGTVINFTDNSWSGTLAATEQTVTWTSTAAILAGREIRISGPSAGAATAVFAGNGSSAGACTGPMPSFATAGDQVLAYQGLPAAPTFIAGLHMNQYHAPTDPCGTTITASWDPAGCGVNLNSSQIPTGLVSGTSALWIGNSGAPNTDVDNAVFNCTGPLATAAQVRAAVNNPANWTTQNGVPTITLPSNCAFLGLFPLPVKLESFTGKLNPDKTVTLQWKVAEQQDIKEYIVEESPDASAFRQLSILPARNAAADTYSYIDRQVAPGKNYYRLKITELSGKIVYSNTVMINLKSGVIVMLYPNPVKDKLTIQQFETIQNKTVILSDGHGRILQQVKLTNLQQTVNMETYPAGIYILKMEDGTIFKVLKQ
jgi:hypothetical protein